MGGRVGWAGLGCAGQICGADQVQAWLELLGSLSSLRAGRAVAETKPTACAPDEFSLLPAVIGAGGGCLARISLRGCGTLLLFASRPPASATVDGKPAAAEFDAASHAVRLEVPQRASMDVAVAIRF